MKKWTVIIIVIALVVTLLVINFIHNKPKTNPNEDFLTLKMYDRLGNEIKPKLSIVEGSPGVSSIAFTIKLSNTGEKDITCGIGNLLVNDVVESNFDDSFQRIEQTIPQNSYKSWTSSLIDTSVYINSQPNIFNASLICTYGEGLNVYNQTKSGSLSVLITPDLSGEFSVQAIKGGIPTEWCGDGICQLQSAETCSYCPNDNCCIKFRTSDLTYNIHSAIGYSNCGNQLNGYGNAGISGCTTGAFDTSVSCPSVTSYTNVLKYNKGSWDWGVGDMCLYTKDGDAITVRLYQQTVSATASTPCGVIGRGGYYEYKTTDGDAGNVDISSTIINLTMEVSCP